MVAVPVGVCIFIVIIIIAIFLVIAKCFSTKQKSSGTVYVILQNAGNDLGVHIHALLCRTSNW